MPHITESEILKTDTTTHNRTPQPESDNDSGKSAYAIIPSTGCTAEPVVPVVPVVQQNQYQPYRHNLKQFSIHQIQLLAVMNQC